MSRPIRSFPDWQRKDIILRRLKNRKRGLGFWAAVDAAKKHYKKDDKISKAIPKRRV